MAPIFATQILYLFYLIFAFTGMGMPVSMPPGVEDPFLSKIAPDECLYYTNWAGMAAADPASENEIEQLFCEPEVSDFLEYINTRVRGTILRVMEQVPDPSVSRLAEPVVVFAELVLTQPTTIFVTNFSVDPVDMDAALVIRLGKNKAKTEAALGKLQKSVLQQFSQPVVIQGKPFTRFQTGETPMITWGIDGEYLMIGIGEQAIDGILTRSSSPPPAWLSELQAKHTLPRRATFTYADLRSILALGIEYVDDPDLIEVYTATGLQHLESYVCVTGLDEKRFVSRTQIKIKDEPTGLLSALPGKPLTRDDLSTIPADSLVGIAVKTNVGEVFDTFIEFLRDVEPANANEIDAMLAGMGQSLNVDLREDILHSLGDVICVHTSPDDGGLLTGWTLTIPVTDADRLKEADGAIMKQLQRQPGLRISVSDAGGQSVASLSMPGSPFAPSWCVTGSEFIFALYPQAVRSHMRPSADARSIADLPEVKQLLDAAEGPAMIAYQDSKAITRGFYPFVQMALQTYAGLLQSENIDVDISMLPTAGALTRHMKPGTWSMQRNRDGYLIESRQSVPGGNIGAVAPVIVAMTLPAGHAARIAASRNQSINNLRQLALASINHESAFGTYPAAYNTDENGKPLLSWRVHILPFMEEDELYNEFRLDEPWDSPHNRKLIPRMPQAYRAPNSRSDPGKTNYLAARGPRGVIVPPAEDQNGKQKPDGLKIRKIKDGTSKTVLIVETSDELAAIWTKPDDFTPDEVDPVKGLVGLQANLFLAAFGDGSVQTINATVAPDTLKALFTRDGGEVVGPY